VTPRLALARMGAAALDRPAPINDPAS
jgi:hypothetical protein